MDLCAHIHNFKFCIPKFCFGWSIVCTACVSKTLLIMDAGDTIAESENVKEQVVMCTL